MKRKQQVASSPSSSSSFSCSSCTTSSSSFFFPPLLHSIKPPSCPVFTCSIQLPLCVSRTVSTLAYPQVTGGTSLMRGFKAVGLGSAGAQLEREREKPRRSSTPSDPPRAKCDETSTSAKSRAWIPSMKSAFYFDLQALAQISVSVFVNARRRNRNVNQDCFVVRLYRR